MGGGWGWRPYVLAAQRRVQGLREIETLRKKGYVVSPVVLHGRTIASTFWGKAWCDNLERYSDFANRLPRGRTYVRNGSIIDLQVARGEITALVSGSAIYRVTVNIVPVAKTRWRSICKDCAGAIDSLVELLQGRLSQGVMERMCRQKTGLFPSPGEIKLACSCPDWAGMCKHVAAVLYGVGARLDREPELLFRLHNIDEKELIAKAGCALPLKQTGPAASKVLDDEDLSELFALNMAQSTEARARFSDEPARKLKNGGYRRHGRNATSEKMREAAPEKQRDSAGSRRRVSREEASVQDNSRGRTMKKGVDQKMKAWDDAQKRHRLSNAQVQMARELGMNPAKLGKIDNHKQEPWKLPLPEFIEELHTRRFGKAAQRSIAIEEE
jgi:uncharacterized Zn finger protein